MECWLPYHINCGNHGSNCCSSKSSNKGRCECGARDSSYECFYNHSSQGPIFLYNHFPSLFLDLTIRIHLTVCRRSGITTFTFQPFVMDQLTLNHQSTNSISKILQSQSSNRSTSYNVKLCLISHAFCSECSSI